MGRVRRSAKLVLTSSVTQGSEIGEIYPDILMRYAGDWFLYTRCARCVIFKFFVVQNLIMGPMPSLAFRPRLRARRSSRK